MKLIILNIIIFFDVIHLGDVLEHVIDPKYLLINLHKNKEEWVVIYRGSFREKFKFSKSLNSIFWQYKKKFLSANYKNNFKPYHLFFCDFQNQLSMIKNINKFKIIDYEIYETGWPYNSGGYLKKV